MEGYRQFIKNDMFGCKSVTSTGIERQSISIESAGRLWPAAPQGPVNRGQPAPSKKPLPAQLSSDSRPTRACAPMREHALMHTCWSSNAETIIPY